MNELFQLILDLSLQHCFQFDYTARSHPKINEVLYQCLCGEIDEDTFEIQSTAIPPALDGGLKLTIC